MGSHAKPFPIRPPRGPSQYTLICLPPAALACTVRDGNNARLTNFPKLKSFFYDAPIHGIAEQNQLIMFHRCYNYRIKNPLLLSFNSPITRLR